MSTGTIDVQLNEEQKKAVTHGDGPLLIVAGAGTGKTTVITQRILHLLVDKQIPTDAVLALTFTEKAAGEMLERVDQLLPYGYVDLWISTFHAFCQRVLERHGLDIGIPNEFRVLSQTDAWLLVRENLDRFSLDYYRPLGNPTKFIHALLQHFSRCKDEAITPKEYLAYAEHVRLTADSALSSEETTLDTRRIQEIADAYHAYEQLLLDHDALDFGDLMIMTRRLFLERPNILATYQRQFQYMLVDEFQDTNWVQYELMKLLAAPRKNLTVVADDDQSIFQWRGASMNNVLYFKKDYPSAAQVVLTRNYRSRQNILDCAYQFIQHNNPNRLEYQLQHAETLVAHAKEKGVDLRSFIPISKRLTAFAKGKGRIECLHGATIDDEVKKVVDTILALRAKDEQCSWNDIAILVRANAHAAPFLVALDALDIPYRFLASRGLFAKRVVLDVLSYLRLLDDYHESSALYRVLTWKIWKLTPETIMTLLHVARRKNESLYESLKHARSIGGLEASVHTTLARILSFLEQHQRIAQERPVTHVVLTVLEETGYLRDLSHRATTHRNAIESLNHLRQLFQRMDAFAHAHEEADVKHFLQFLDLARESGDEGKLETSMDDGPEAVKILTVHGAKGLEFRYVFVVNCVDLRFPSTDRKDPISLPEPLTKEILPEGDVHIQEERRLFYVAITRARDGIFFSYADSYGGKRQCRPSPFFVEAGIVEAKKHKNKKTQKHGESIEHPLASFAPLSKQGERIPPGVSVTAIPKAFSYTQLKAFEICPYQYRFAHILKIPVRGKYTFSFGRTMHLTLQRFYERMMERSSQTQGELFHKKTKKQRNKEIQAPSLKELLEIYDETWIDEWYESRDHQEKYKAEGRRALKDFYASQESAWVVPRALEQSFTAKIGNHVLKGTIDRIDPHGDGVEIIDYKTGNPPSSPRLGSDEKEQLLIYQFVADEVLHEKVNTLSYWYLKSNRKVSFLGTEGEVKKMKEKILATIEAMKASDFEATPSPYKCRNCDFKEICEYRQL